MVHTRGTEKLSRRFFFPSSLRPEQRMGIHYPNGHYETQHSEIWFRPPLHVIIFSPDNS